VSVIAAVVALESSSGAWASPSSAPASGSSSITLLPTTTTTTPPANTTTTVAASTTTTSPATTSTPAAGKGNGVPKVPVSGPPTTVPRKGAKRAPPANPGPVLAAVQADLSQLTAIQDYAQDKVAVANSEEGVTLAAAEVQSAAGVVDQDLAAQQTAQQQVNEAAARLRGLALAAYMGLGYLSPAAGPLGGGPSTGTVSTLGGLTGTEAVDAEEMLKLVAQHVRQGVTNTHRALRQAQQVTAAARKTVTQAQATLATARAGLGASQRTLALVTQAATTPGAAATLLNQPNGQALALGSAGATTDSPSEVAAAAVTTTAAPTTVPAGTGATADSVDAAATVTMPTSPTILGPGILDGAEMAKWFATTGHKASVTVPITQLAADYQKAGQQTGVRADVAFAQSIVETGYFSFPSYGQLTPKDNNFAGIGACDSCAHGWSFPNALTGVTAQMELLDAYASPTLVPTPLVGNVGIGGCCTTWMALAGRWASSLQYGISIMTIYQQMLNWVIPQRLVTAGLIAAPPAAPPKGPTLATLPSSPPPN